MGKKIKITKNWTLNICIAADISESIGDEDLTLAKNTVITLITKVRKTTRFHLIITVLTKI